jgi:hypothetical protein
MQYGYFTAHKGTAKIEVNQRSLISLSVSCSESIVVVDTAKEGDASLVVTFPPGGMQRQRFYVPHATTLIVSPVKKTTEFAMAARVRPLQTGEPLDDLPPPEPEASSNLIAQLHDRFRRGMVMREEFEQIDRYSSDEPLMFEEEEAQLMRVSDGEEGDGEPSEEQPSATPQEPTTSAE